VTDWYERLPAAGYRDESICNIGWWQDGRLRSLVEHPRVVPILAPRASGRPCVELCSGRGGNLGLLAGMGADPVVGLDRSPTQVRAAGPGVILADALALPIASRAVGLVVCVEAAGHLGDLVQVLDESARVLDVGGALVLIELLADQVWACVEPVAEDLGLHRTDQLDLTDVVHESFAAWGSRPHPFGPVFEYLKARREGWTYRAVAYERVPPPGPVRARPRARLVQVSRWGARRTTMLLREDGSG
jgi:SAM-dependent methyltransferase